MELVSHRHAEDGHEEDDHVEDGYVEDGYVEDDHVEDDHTDHDHAADVHAADADDAMLNESIFYCFRWAPPLHEHWGTGGSSGKQRGGEHIPGRGDLCQILPIFTFTLTHYSPILEPLL